MISVLNKKTENNIEEANLSKRKFTIKHLKLIFKMDTAKKQIL